MEIIDNRKIIVTIPELSQGDTFRSYGETFIKTNQFIGDVYKCVNLKTGKVEEFDKKCEVITVNAKVVIEEWR